MIAFVLGVIAASAKSGLMQVRLRVNIHQHRKRIGKQNRAGSGDERKVRQNHLVPGSDAEPRHRDFQSGSSVGHCDAVASSVKLGEGAFEL